MHEQCIENSTILVTGGAGFVGSHLVDQLLNHNPKRIIVLDNLVRGSKINLADALISPKVELIVGDIRDSVLLKECVDASDYVFHMAALRINACHKDPNAGFEVMVQACHKLIDMVANSNVKKIVYSSSASIYGDAESFPTSETCHPYSNRTYYGAAKLFGEQVLRTYHYTHRLNYIGLRYFNIYGPRMDTEGVYTEVLIKWLKCIKERLVPEIHGDGKTSMDFVFVQDVVQANIKALLSHTTDEIYNVATEVETDLSSLLTTLLKVNNCSISPKYVNVVKANPVSRRLASIDKISKDLSYIPEYSLDKGLELLSKWYMENR
ncbi:NAD-dependent epimerase/dehydratase family protein [Pseudobacteriovorax antillogorgiicola]|uniref:UDP-glucose 4-epimerase n=1 Tax=Pseudobacteriovorax antillogorgiicola TaxID=1513793 RepID=A0A1Y6CLI4_9BACT|nr:NAD-dependent epimerase/dehydratase family protein [Pseudobacteriovorax antillogorgiicola]TCS45194.1 UDP-glucose 4-epimerase [Pseudobacteriovorax antillogorgiicola]SMF75594.1 UDP-glucose 4-epimerase [Pseudobacteriovorax antillogorgiicola]